MILINGIDDSHARNNQNDKQRLSCQISFNQTSTSALAKSGPASSQMSVRNNFEHRQSRKAILKNALAEI